MARPTKHLLLLLCVVATGIAGCAIHPLPEDYTGIKTFQIVRKIRCEARDSLIEELKVLLRHETDDAYAQETLRELNGRTKSTDSIDYGKFGPKTRGYIDKFADSAIGYNFTFDITETNNIDATVDLLGTFARGTGKLGVGLGDDRTRHNIRSFTITDTFHGLLTDMKDKTCSGLDLQSKNYQYPITGNIGIGEMVETFVDLSLFGNLENKDIKGPPTMADTITFETKLSGTLTPRVELTPLHRGVSLADAFLTASASRDDIHSVVVALSLPVPPPKGSKAAKTFTGQFVTVKGSPAEVSVGEAISQQILRFEQGNRTILLNRSTLDSTL